MFPADDTICLPVSSDNCNNKVTTAELFAPTLNAVAEKPHHYKYLKEFRVEPCSAFRNHQCLQHRPFTCFHWHFANQRRRRPVRRRDATFNYSPDIYCSKYDENLGVCPDGDECPLLHRVAGDVERKYHLRYYKTALCVHATDTRGQCSKNGAHCAFAHNSIDLRTPIFDIREIQAGVDHAGLPTSALVEQKERTSFVIEDTVWQDQEHVLACYKTEPCKKPPRLCRQGYACPFYHNGKDRRRPPGIFRYRSTPCPSAKSAEEWTDPDGCAAGENCQYCHTRTEQQFHPEIYKSTKCNDMLQHGYCPRGPFCAFGHNDAELHCERQVRKPTPTPTHHHITSSDDDHVHVHDDLLSTTMPVVSLPEAPLAPSPTTNVISSTSPAHLIAGNVPSYSRQSIPSTTTTSKIFGRTSIGTGHDTALSSSYPKAPGFERLQFSPTRTSWSPDIGSTAGGRMRTTSLNMGQLDLGYTLGSNEIIGTPPTPGGSLRSNSFSPFARASSHDQQQHGGVLTGGYVDDLGLLDDTPLATIAEQREDQLFSESLNHNMSAPVQIPGTAKGCSTFGGSSSSPYFDASGSTGGDMAVGFGRFSFESVGSGMPTTTTTTTIHMPSGFDETLTMVQELQRARDELISHRQKVANWEETLKQARQACEAWKKDAESHRRIAISAAHERDQALQQLEALRVELHSRHLLPLNNLCIDSNDSTTNSAQAQHHMTTMRSTSQRGPVCARCGRHVNNNGSLDMSVGSLPNSCAVCSVKQSPPH